MSHPVRISCASQNEIMAEYKRKDMPEDMIVRISPGRNTITVQECSANGVVSYREIDPIEFYFALNGSCISNVYQRSGFLPEHCLHISMNAEERHYVIWNPELRADVIYRDTEYRSFPLPRLIFGLRVLGNGKVADCSMGVVADETPTEDTPMFFYPFSNVYEDDRVCTGNNVLPRYKKLSALKNFPRYLLGLPDNDDMFDRRHNRKELEHKELMELLRDKDPAYYYTDKEAYLELAQEAKVYPMPQAPSPQTQERQPVPLEQRHAAYSDMLEHLTLLDRHGENLLERGLSEERIRANGYGITLEQMKQYFIEHRRARKTGDKKTMEKIEYHLTYINFHYECGLLISGQYDKLPEVIRNW